MVMNRSAARSRVIDWIDVELTQYANAKWEREGDDAKLRDEGLMPGSYWRDFIDQYIHRAAVLGLDTEVGQQALLKAVVTLYECAVSMTVNVDGKIPLPGHPSGEIVR